MDIQVFLNRGWLAKLRGRRSIEIEAHHPHSCFVQYFALLIFRCRFNGGNLVQIEVSCNPTDEKEGSV